MPETFQVELYVRADDFLPAEFTIDMSGLKAIMGDTAGERHQHRDGIQDDGSEIPLQSVQCHF